MRSRLTLFALSFCLALAMIELATTGCSSKPAANNSTDSSTTADNQPAPGASTSATEEKKTEKKKEPLVVPAGTSITVSLRSALGSKLSQPGSTFQGSVAKSVMVGGAVAIPKGATVSGTVTDAKALGKFSGGAVLQVRLDSINLNGADMQVQAALRTFNAKGKGKRTAVLAGGGAAVGGIIGALAGGGKGAAIGMAAGGGAGAGGAAFTGNKDIVLPAESDLTFELSQPLEIKR
ncbi:MAG TPA: hypothetical protein VMH04_13960 [Candidatus Solibacter sp.]|nr:hypothetical protein [Candidatus Solibacter sp.]